MNTRDHEPLTPEEHELAQRLSRLGGHAAPSAALDAKILAAARSAVQPKPRRLQSRWPLGVGIAASLALAVGVAWQLRPMPGTEAVPAPSESDVAAILQIEPRTADTTPPPALREAVVAPPPDEAADAPAMPAIEAPQEPVPQTRAVQEDDARQSLRYAPAPTRVEAPVVFDDPAPVQPPPPAPPAPPPPPATAAPASSAMPTPVFVPSPPAEAALAEVRSREEARSREQAQQARKAESAAAMRASQASEAESLDRVMVTGSRMGRTRAASANRADQSRDTQDSALGEQPPASFSTPAARDAWLQRIRELVREGDLDGARESLLEFRRRHPDHAVPEDLKALLDE